MEEWIAKIEKLWEYYSRGKYEVVLEKGEGMLLAIPDCLKTLLYLALADCALQMDQISHALPYMEKAREFFNAETLYVDEPTLVTKENLPYFFKGELKKCRENLLRSSFQDSYLIQSNIAQCSYWLGEFEVALREYASALELCANNENLSEEANLCRVGQANCHIRLGNLETVEHLLSDIVEQQKSLFDDSTPDVRIAATALLACVHAWQNRIPEARLAFHTDLNPDKFELPYKKSTCYFYRGIVRFAANSLEEAEEDFRKVVELPIRQFDKIEAHVYLCDIASQKDDPLQIAELYQKVMAFPEVFLASQVTDRLAQKIKKQQVSQEIHWEAKPDDLLDVSAISQSSDESLGVPQKSEEVGQLLDIPQESEEAGQLLDIPQESKEVGQLLDIPQESKEVGQLLDIPQKSEGVGQTLDISQQSEITEEVRSENEIWSELPLVAILLGLETLASHSNEHIRY